MSLRPPPPPEPGYLLSQENIYLNLTPIIPIPLHFFYIYFFEHPIFAPPLNPRPGHHAPPRPPPLLRHWSSPALTTVIASRKGSIGSCQSQHW